VAVGEQRYQVRLADRQRNDVEDVGEVRRRHGEVSLASRPRCRSGDYVLVKAANPLNWPRPV